MQRDIAYGADPEQKLDIYHPGTGGIAPLVVFLHGGGWTRGSKNVAGRVAPLLLRHGYAVASLDYRLVPRTDPAGAVQDAADGIAYLMNNAVPLGLDTSRLALLGHSVGGHIAALLATDERYLRQACVEPGILAAVITLDGLFDVPIQATDHPTPEMARLFGTDPAGWRLLSPAHLVGTMTINPAFCLTYGDVHRAFPKHAGSFEKALNLHKKRVQTLLVPGVAHMDMLKRFADPDLPIAGFVVGCLNGEMVREESASF